ncbi:MAG: hypothetical protein NXI01_02240 [Gammaproteobacteria bacterium]|nr:hypothetical protein [Gammaproteobacteria bacterium]
MASDLIDTTTIPPYTDPSSPAHAPHIPSDPHADTALFSLNRLTRAFYQVTDRVTDFIKPHAVSGDAYRGYGVADGTNLALSYGYIPRVFSHAYHHTADVLSPQTFQVAMGEFHESEKTAEGFAFASVFTVFIVAFSTLGSTATKKDGPRQQWLAFLWPYVRDMLKEIKWTLKGVWAVLLLALQYGASQALLANAFFPMIVIAGAIAVINRLWLRWMRDSRKDLVKVNIALKEQIAESKSLLHDFSLLPDDLSVYDGSLIATKIDTYYFVEDGKLCETKVGTEAELDALLKTHPNAKRLPRMYRYTDVEGAVQEIAIEDEVAFKELKGNYPDATLSAGEEDRVLYYISEGKCRRFQIDDWSKFDEQLESLQNTNVHTRMKQYLQFLIRQRLPAQDTGEEQAEEQTAIRLHFISEDLSKQPDLKLMSSLEGDLNNAEEDIIYLNEKRNTYFVKGMEIPAYLPIDMDLTNLEKKLKGADFKNAILKITSEAGHTVTAMDTLLNDTNYHNAHVYLSHKNQQCLCYIDAAGEIEFLHEESQKFHDKYLESHNDPSVLRLTEAQIKTLAQEPNAFDELELGKSYQTLLSERLNLISATELNHREKNAKGKPKNRDKILFKREVENAFAIFSAGCSGVWNGFYFYGYAGTAALSILSSSMALLVLGVAACLFMVCVITRTSEEFDFQRRMAITTLRPQVEISQKICTALHARLEKELEMQKQAQEGCSNNYRPECLNSELMGLHELAKSSRNIRRGRAHAIDVTAPFSTDDAVSFSTDDAIQEEGENDDSDSDSSQIDDGIDMLWTELAAELKHIQVLQDELKEKLQGSVWSAGLAGLQNGLAIQGAIASFSFAFSTFFYGSITACPPLFILSCMAVGVAALVVCCLQSVLSYQIYKDNLEQKQAELAKEFPLEQQILDEKYKSGDPRCLETMRTSVENIRLNGLQAQLDYVIVEWSELFRLFFNGLMKGKKGGAELMFHLLRFAPEDLDLSWLKPIILFGGAIAFGGFLFIRGMAKGFGVGKPDGNRDVGDETPKARNWVDTTEKLSQNNMYTSLRQSGTATASSHATYIQPRI